MLDKLTLWILRGFRYGFYSRTGSYTHVVIWLFSGEIDKLSTKARALIEESELFVSAMVMLELELLYEIGRLTYKHDQILTSLSESIDLKVCPLSFNVVAKASTKLVWTRDPFDRLIVANAQCRSEALLLTRDRKILEHYSKATW